MQSSTESAMATPCPYLLRLKRSRELGTSILDFLIEHYALMAMNPATIEQSRLRARELKGDFPTLGILIAKRLKEMKNEGNN